MGIDVPIIDPHHHLWTDPPFPQFPVYPVDALARDRVQARAAGHDIRATVFVDCMRDYLVDGPAELRVLGETRATEAEARESEEIGGDRAGICAGIVGRADLRTGARVEEVLQAHLAESPTRFRGIRHMAPWLGDVNFFDLPITEHMMCTPEFAEGFATLAKLDLTFDAWVLATQLDDVVTLARAVPQGTIVLDHAGTPLGIGPFEGKPEESFAMWRDGMAAVAQCPNVVVKLGGLLMHVTGLALEDSPAMTPEQVAAALGRHVHTVIELFGPDRCMLESNFPVDGAHVGYTDLWSGFELLTAELSRDERAALYAGTAARVYRIELG
jgi:predicted TIM-barrel fold metal-dependent hydrolase